MCIAYYNILIEGQRVFSNLITKRAEFLVKNSRLKTNKNVFYKYGNCQRMFNEIFLCVLKEQILYNQIICPYYNLPFWI